MSPSKGRGKGCSRQWWFKLVIKETGCKVIKGKGGSESELPGLITIGSGQMTFLLRIYLLIGSLRENERVKKKNKTKKSTWGPPLWHNG